MVRTLKKVKDNALKRGDLGARVHHGLDPTVAVLDLHGGASIDHHEDVDVARQQVQRCLLHADVGLAPVQDH